MEEIIKIDQLGFNTQKKSGKLAANAVAKILKINKLNKLFEDIDPDDNTQQICEKILEKQNIKIVLKINDIHKSIKKNEPQIIVCNLPHGALDAIIILNEILKIRTDVKIIAPEIFKHLEKFNQNFLALDKPRTKNISTKTIENVRLIKKHLDNKGLIITFPAGEVATYQKGISAFRDKKWNPKLLKILLNARCEIVPIVICGRNNWRFHTLAKIQPKLAELTLIQEFIRTQNETIDMLVGKPFDNKILNKIEKPEEFEKLARGNMIMLRNVRVEEYERKQTEIEEIAETENSENQKNNKKNVGKIQKTLSNIIKETAEIEMMNFDENLKVIDDETFAVYQIEKKSNPEITKLANENFKKIQNLNHKHCMVLVDKENKEIAALIEIGYGNKIVSEQGADGFYCYENFDFSHKLINFLGSAVEIGQIAKLKQNLDEITLWEYTINSVRKSIARSRKYNHIIVTTDVCDSNSYTARRLVVNQLMQYDFDRKFRKLVTPHNNISRLESPILDRGSIELISKVGAFGHFISDAESGYESRADVFRLVSQLGGKIMGINSSGSEGEGVISVLMNIPKK